MDDHESSKLLTARPALPRATLTILAGVLAVCFIAIGAVGFGSFHRMIVDPARATVCVSLFLLAVLTPACGCNLNPGEQIDLSNDWIFAVMLIAGMAMGWAAAYSDRRNTLTLGGEAVRWLGVGLFLLGTVFRLGSIIQLGSRFTVWVALQTNHHLTMSGLYRFIRHPSYTGAALTVIGWAVTFRSIVGVALAVVVLLPLLSRIGAEEDLLIEEFGDEYRQYQQRTWRLVPFVY